jgi:hypothetical protein
MADKVYKCLNPVGIQDSVELFPISKRLDSLDGKEIFFSIGAGGEQDIILPLTKRLQKDYPNVKWHMQMTAAHATKAGSSALSEEEMKIADAVIRGVVW